MTEVEVIAKLEQVFRDIFDEEELTINNETTAEDIEDWDSLAHINLVVSIEKEFDVKFALGELQALQNVGDMVDLVIRKSIKEQKRKLDLKNYKSIVASPSHCEKQIVITAWIFQINHQTAKFRKLDHYQTV